MRQPLKEDRAIKDKDGRAKLYADIRASDTTRACREMIQDKVIHYLSRRIRQSQLPGYVSSYDDSTRITPGHRAHQHARSRAAARAHPAKELPQHAKNDQPASNRLEASPSESRFGSSRPRSSPPRTSLEPHKAPNRPSNTSIAIDHGLTERDGFGAGIF